MSDSFAAPWTVAFQTPLSMGFPRQEYWGGCHFFFQNIFPTQGLKPHLLQWHEGSLPLSHLGSPGRNIYIFKSIYLFLVTLVFIAVHGLSLVVASRGLLSSCSAWAYHLRGLSCCGARALGRAGFIRQSWSMGFIAPWHVGVFPDQGLNWCALHCKVSS